MHDRYQVDGLPAKKTLGADPRRIWKGVRRHAQPHDHYALTFLPQFHARETPPGRESVESVTTQRPRHHRAGLVLSKVTRSKT